MIHLGDITKISGYTAPVVDCIIGGSPCQDLSVAGKRAGLEGQRSGLFMEQIRIIKEKTSESYSKKQRKSLTKMPLFLDLRRASGQRQDASWQMGGALLGEYSMHSFGESPKEGVESHLSQILEDNPHPKYSLSDKACLGILTRARRRGKQLPPVLEEALIQMVVGGTEYGQEGIADTIEILRNNQIATVYSVENHPNDSRVGINEDGKVQALTSRMGTGGGNVPMVMQQCFSKSKRAKTATDNETWVEIETANTLNAFDVGDVRTTEVVVYALDTNHPTCTVRRLTPLECERLQGYPDGWTDIGEYTNSQGKKCKASDASRYKALGNSIALPS